MNFFCFSGGGGNGRGATKKIVYLKSRWSEYKKYCVKFPLNKLSILNIFCISWGGGPGRGATKKVSVP